MQCKSVGIEVEQMAEGVDGTDRPQTGAKQLSDFLLCIIDFKENIKAATSATTPNAAKSSIPQRLFPFAA